MKNTLETLKDQLTCMLAVQQLEYHNKNLLSGDTKSRCEYMIDDFKHAIKLVENAIKEVSK